MDVFSYETHAFFSRNCTDISGVGSGIGNGVSIICRSHEMRRGNYGARFSGSPRFQKIDSSFGFCLSAVLRLTECSLNDRVDC